MQKRLTINKDFKPCPADDGEEVYANGIFKFNISKMITHIQNNPDVFPTETVVVKDIYSKSSHINELLRGKQLGIRRGLVAFRYEELCNLSQRLDL